MRHFISASLMIGLAVVACHKPTKVSPPRDDEESMRPVDKSSNAALAGLSLSAGTLTPAFAEDTTAYTIDVAYPTSATTVAATVADAKASVALNGAALSSATASAALPLPVGATQFAVVVTAEDGTTSRTYTVTVNRPRPSADATLSALVFGAGTLAFDSSQTRYALDLRSSDTITSVTATTTQTTASLQINGSAETSGQASREIALAYGENVIDVVVTAEDGITQQTYQLTITRLVEAADAMLSALVPSVGTLAFSPVGDVYNVDVQSDLISIAFTSTANHADATITLNGTKVNSGQASAAIALEKPGTYDLAFVVTAQDGRTKRTYTVHVRKLLNTELKALAINLGTLEQLFDASTLSYTATVDSSTAEITVEATLVDPTSSLKIAGILADSGTPIWYPRKVWREHHRGRGHGKWWEPDDELQPHGDSRLPIQHKSARRENQWHRNRPDANIRPQFPR